MEIVEKRDSNWRMAYGIVLTPGEVDDEQDIISKEEIEKAAYAFMQLGGASK